MSIKLNKEAKTPELLTADAPKFNRTDKYMSSSMLRDQAFEVNGSRMRNAEKHMKTCADFGLFTGAALSAASLVLFISKLVSSVQATVVLSAVNTLMPEGEEQYVDFDFSGWLMSFFPAVINAVMSVLAGKFEKKKANIVLYGVYIVYAVLSVLLFMGIPDDMPWFFGFFFALYSIIGIFVTDRNYASLKDIDFLKTQEGYPDFNLSMHYMARSRYVKMREEYVNKQKRVERKPPEEKFIAPISEQPASEEDMGGISADKKDMEKWFGKAENYSPQERIEYEMKFPEDLRQLPENELDTISAGEENIDLPEKEYIPKGDNKYRPL